MQTSKIKYFVNENEKIVVATAMFKVYGKMFKCRGKAKCSVEDNFDLEKGKQIARIRMHTKANDKLKRLFVRSKKQHIDKFDFEINKLSNIIDKNNKALEKLLQ